MKQRRESEKHATKDKDLENSEGQTRRWGRVIYREKGSLYHNVLQIGLSLIASCKISRRLSWWAAVVGKKQGEGKDTGGVTGCTSSACDPSEGGNTSAWLPTKRIQHFHWKTVQHHPRQDKDGHWASRPDLKLLRSANTNFALSIGESPRKEEGCFNQIL